jgi:hypothetical protein
MTATSQFEGTASDLLKALNGVVSETQQKAKGWPKRPANLGKMLRRIAAPLRKVGIDIAFDREGKPGARSIKIEHQPVEDGKAPPAPSAPSATNNLNHLGLTVDERSPSASPSALSAMEADSAADSARAGTVSHNPLKNNAADSADGKDSSLHTVAGRRVCAQCHGPPDGKERQCAYGDEAIWLHPECERFFIKAKMEEHGIPRR